MKPESTGKEMPEDAADAWAEVYIDVAEKLDAEEQEAPGKTTNSEPRDEANYTNENGKNVDDEPS